MSRKNSTEKYADTGKKMFIKYGLGVIGAMVSVKASAMLLDKFGSKLPAVATKYAPIAIPFVGGVVLATKANNKNEIAQGVAGGMVFSSVQNLMNEVLPTGQQLSDAIGFTNKNMLADVDRSDLIVKPDGSIFDTQGNAMGVAQAALPAKQPRKPPRQFQYWKPPAILKAKKFTKRK